MTPFRPESAGGADAPEREGCPCARHLDAEFQCRAEGEACPRLRWLRTLLAESVGAGRQRDGHGEVARLVAALDLPDDVAETAHRLFARVREHGFVHGRSVERVAAAVVYAAARQSRVPRTLGSVADAGDVERDRLAGTFRQLPRELGLAVEPLSPTDLLPRYAAALDLPAGTERAAGRLLDASESYAPLSGRHPLSVVAAAIYAAGLLTGRRVYQQRISDATGVSQGTIRELYPRVIDALEAETSK